jgi:hypothetical protein
MEHDGSSRAGHQRCRARQKGADCCPHQRVYQTVDLFSSAIIEALRTEETKPDMWFVIVPDEVHQYLRPKSIVARSLRVEADQRMNPRWANE